MTIEGHGVRVVDEHDEVGVAHAGRVAPVVDAVDDASRSNGLVGVEGIISGVNMTAHVGLGVVDLAVLGRRRIVISRRPAAGVDDQPVVGAEPELGRHMGQAAQPVAADLGQAAVGVGQLHLAVGAVARRRVGG